MSALVTVQTEFNFRQTRPVWTALSTTSSSTRPLTASSARLAKAAQTTEATYKLPVNVAQDEHNYYIFAQLPGVQADKLEINAVENKLTITGEVQKTLLAPQLPAPRKARKSRPSSGCARSLAPRT